MDSTDKKNKGNFLTDYLRIFAKHKFLVIIPLVTVFLGSAIVGSTFPKVYTGAAFFRMLTPRVSGAQSFRRRAGDDDLKVMSQTILSRSNLVEIIKDVGLDASYAGVSQVQQEAYEEQLVQQLRKDLTVQEKARNMFEIAYRCDDPDMAARVANSAMTHYIEGVEKDERARMAATVLFLEKQVKGYQTRASASSEKLAAFKAAHILELPGSELSNSTELKSLRDLLATAEGQLSDAETNRKETEKQILAIDSTVVGETVVETNPLVAQYHAQLDRLELDLANLQSRFTDLHPEVVKKKSEIQSIKSLMEKAAEKITTRETHEANPLYVSLQQELKNSERQVASAKRRKEQLLAKMAECEKRVQSAPALEKQMSKLTEDDALNKKLLGHYTTELQNAKIEQEREKDQKGIRFQVLDFAKKSSTSATSNGLKVSLLGLVVGAGLGFGLAVLRDQTDTSFKDVEDAASFLDIPIIGTIPVINTTAERAREKKKEAVGWVIVGALVVLLIAVLIVTSLTSFPGR